MRSRRLSNTERMPLKDLTLPLVVTSLCPIKFIFSFEADRVVLSEWIKGLKRAISIALKAGKEKIAWQPGFFDHILRNDESYSEKWEYVRQNPARAGLVRSADEWSYQGEIVLIDRA